MNRLLIIGCGDVARRILPALARVYRVYALVREYDNGLKALGVTQILGDLDHAHTLVRLAGLADLVLYTAPPSEDAAHDRRMQTVLNVLRRGQRPPRALVYISTSGVYGDHGGAVVSETTPNRAESPRGKRRAAAEAALREFGRGSACRIVILRAPGIYAQDRLPLERLQRGTPVLFAKEDVYTNHIHAEDLGRACLLALHRGGHNRTYNVNDDSVLKMGDWFDLLADTHGLRRPPRVTRSEAIEHVSPVMLSFMNESRRLDNTRLKRELGFRFKYATVQQALPAPVGKPKPRLRKKAVAVVSEMQTDLFDSDSHDR